MLVIEEKVRGLETRAKDVEDVVQSHAKEVERLKADLATTKKERDVERSEKVQIDQKAYNEAYEAYESSFKHCLRQVLFHYEVLEESIFDIDKDVYNG